MHNIQNKIIKIHAALKKSMNECKNFNLARLLLWMSFIFCIIPPLFCCIYDYCIFHYLNINSFCILIMTYLPWQFPLMLERIRNYEVIWNTLITLTVYTMSIVLMLFAP